MLGRAIGLECGPGALGGHVLVSAVLLTANGFEMARLLGRGLDGVDLPRVLVC